MIKQLPYNPTIISFGYSNEVLEVVFRKPKLKAGIQTRKYSGVPSDIAYKWFYKDSVTELLSFYAKNIRKKFELIELI